MADWYVYQHDGDPLGPWSTEAVADAILTGKLAPDVWIAAPGGPRWLRALDVPVIGRLVEGVPTKPRRRDSGLRLIPGVFASGDQRPFFGSATMIVKDDEIHFTDAPATMRGLPSLSSTPSADDTTQMVALPAMSFRLEANDEDDEQLTRRAFEVGTGNESLEDAPSTDPALAERRQRGA